MTNDQTGRRRLYVAPVTECEGCMTEDACRVRGQCAHYLRESDAESAGLTACVTCGAPAGVHADPMQPSAQQVRYVPVDSRLRDENWRHPNDDEPRSEACLAALRERGDDIGQGLDSYWKWGFAAGFNAACAQAKPAGDANMPVVAWEDTEAPGELYARLPSWLRTGDPLVREKDAHAAIRGAYEGGRQEGRAAATRGAPSAIAARDARIAELEQECRDRKLVSCAQLDRIAELEREQHESAIASAMQISRISELECEVGRLTDLTINQQIAECERKQIASEYAETYARAQAQAAFWVWHALTHGRDPDMVPEEFLRPSGRITWLRDTDASKPAELMTPAELEEAYAASAAETTVLDWNEERRATFCAGGDPVVRFEPQKLEWDGERS